MKIDTFLITGFGQGDKPTQEEKTVKSYFGTKGFRIKTSREISLGSSFWSNIVLNIKKAHAVIILLNKERLNVAFEAGVAVGNPHILLPTTILYLVDRRINVDTRFSDLKDIHWIRYRKVELSRLLRKDPRIREWIASTKALVKIGGVRKREKILGQIVKYDPLFQSMDRKENRAGYQKMLTESRKDLGQCLR